MIKILMLEDDKLDAQLAQLELKLQFKNIDFKLVDNRKDFERALEQYNPNLVLSDYSLPSYDGFSALQYCKNKFPELPFVFFTGSMDEETAVNSMKAGAWDYVLKENIVRLNPAVDNALKLKQERDSKQLLQNAILEKDVMLNNLVEHLPGIVFKCEIDKNWTMDFLSSGCYDLTGYHSEDLLHNKKLSFNSIIHPDDRESIINTVNEAIEQDHKYQIEYRIITASGVIKWVLEKGKAIITNNRKALEGFILDISSRKQFQEDLIISQKRYRDIIEKAEVGIWVEDRQGKMIYINETFARLFGYKVEELKVLDRSKIIHPDDFERVNGYHEKRYKGVHVPSKYEFRGVTKTGEIKYFEIAVDVVLSEENQALGNRNYLWDITDRKKSELELKKSENKFRTFAENVPGVVNIYDWYPDGHREFIYQGPGLEDIIGKELSDKMMNNSELYFSLIPKEDLIRVEAAAEEALKNNCQLDVEYRLVLENNKVKWVRARFSLFPHENGVISWQGLVFEITKQKEIQQELLESEERFLQFMNLIPAAAYIKDANSRLIFANKYMTNYLIPENYLNKTPEEYHSPELAAQIRKDDIIALEKSVMDYEDKFPDKFGKIRYFEAHRFNIKRSNGKPLMCGLSVDITQRRTVEKTQKVLFYIANAVNTTKDLNELYSKIREQLGMIFDTTNFFVALKNPKNNGIELAYIKDEKNQVMDLMPDNSICGYVIKNGEPILVNEALREELTASGEIVQSGFPSKIWMGVPLKQHGKVVGVVAVRSYNDPNLYAQSDLDVLTFVSEEIALAIDQKRADDQIKQDLEEKEILIKEVHHRVKNNMQIISSMLKLQSRYIEDESALDLFKNSQNRVRSMALIHERIYRSKDLASVDFGEYVDSLLRSLIINFEITSAKIKLDINCHDVSVKMDQAIPLGLIVNELISNALKHGFKDGQHGHLRVHFTRLENNEYKLLVGNSGIINPEEINFENPDTLGLQLVKALTKQLHGKIKCEYEDETRFIITFAVK